MAKRLFYVLPIALSGIYLSIWILIFVWKSMHTLERIANQKVHAAAHVIITRDVPEPPTPTQLGAEEIMTTEPPIEPTTEPVKVFAVINPYQGNALWTIREFECLGWRETENCDPYGLRIMSKDLTCNDLVSRSASGYCEFRNKTSGEIFTSALSHCAGANEDFRCGDIVMEFVNLRVLANIRMRNPENMRLNPMKSSKRGIILIAQKRYMLNIFTTIKLLKYLGCSLPIEIWLRNGEISRHDPIIHYILSNHKVTLRVVRESYNTKWLVKVYSIFYSEFDEILFIDPNDIFLTNPAFLFDSQEYKKYGVIFWPHLNHNGIDYHEHSMIWELLDITEKEEILQQESPQIMIDKSRHMDVLNLLYFYSYHTDMMETLHLISEEKSFFRLAWIKLGVRYYMIPRSPKSTPYSMKDYFCRQGITNYDADGNPLFLSMDTQDIRLSLLPYVRKQWTKDIKLKLRSRDEESHQFVSSPYNCSSYEKKASIRSSSSNPSYSDLEVKALEYVRDGRMLTQKNL